MPWPHLLLRIKRIAIQDFKHIASLHRSKLEIFWVLVVIELIAR